MFKESPLEQWAMSEQEVTAVILAAGEGRRLAPLTNRRPKPMLPVANKPLLEYVVDAVVAAGIDRLVLVVGYQRDRIQTHFGDGDEWNVEIQYAVQKKQLGTAHALEQAKSVIDGPLLVLNGDRIIDPTVVEEVHAEFTETADPAVMAIRRSSDPSSYGVVTLEDRAITDIVEKPVGDSPSQLINAGVYAFESEAIFDAIDTLSPGPDGEYQLTDALTVLLADGSITPVRYDGRWLDVSHLWDLLTVTGRILDSSETADDTGVSTGPEQPTTPIINENAYLSETATVGANAVIGRGTVVGENAHIGPNVTIERSVIFPDARIGAGAVLRDCIVGANARVGDNATVPSGDSTVVIDGTAYHPTGFGGVFGDNASVGGGVTVEPGTLIGDTATVAPGVTVGGLIADFETVRRG